jgi:hypothetical protein
MSNSGSRSRGRIPERSCTPAQSDNRYLLPSFSSDQSATNRRDFKPRPPECPESRSGADAGSRVLIMRFASTVAVDYCALGGVYGTPAGLCGLDELERHCDAG